MIVGVEGEQADDLITTTKAQQVVPTVLAKLSPNATLNEEKNVLSKCLDQVEINLLQQTTILLRG